MTRVIVRFRESADYVNFEAEEFHEDGNFFKVYNAHQELVGAFLQSEISRIYITERGARQ